MRRAVALLRHRGFMLLWLATMIENLALAVSTLAETWYVADTLHLKAQLGLVLIAASVPRLALMAVGGVLADRISKVTILKSTFWLRAAAVALAAMLFWHGAMSIWALALFAAVFGMLDAFFWPARDALLPAIVDDEMLMQANAFMQASSRIGLIVGPMAGGVLLAALPLPAVFALVAVLMACGALLVARITAPHVARTTPQAAFFIEARDGIAYVWRSALLRMLLLMYAVANLLFMGPWLLGVPLIASERLRAGANGLALLNSATAAGMLAGFALLFAWPPRRRRLLLIACLITVEGVLIACLGHVQTLAPAASLAFVLGFCIACNNVPMQGVIAHYTAVDKMGRVMSVAAVSSMGLAPLSYALVAALLSGGWPVATIMPAFGLTMSAAMLLMIMCSKTVRRGD